MKPDLTNKKDLLPTITQKLKEAYDISGPVFCNIEINPNQKLYPVLKAGASLENQMPLIPEVQLEALRAL